MNNSVQIRQGAGLVLMIALATGCSSSTFENACIPVLTCKTHLELIRESADCTSCADCAEDWGSCNAGGFACKQGRLDLSADSVGCETALGGVSAQFVAHSVGDAQGILSINQDRMDEAIAATVVAFDAVAPGCVPTFDTPCPYTFRGLQISLTDFMVEPTDTLTWKNGTLTLTGPVAASDDGSGLAAPSVTVVLAFNVSDGSQQRVAVASAAVSIGVVFDYTAQAPVNVQLQGGGFDFGGYVIDDIFFSGPLASR